MICQDFKTAKGNRMIWKKRAAISSNRLLQGEKKPKYGNSKVYDSDGKKVADSRHEFKRLQKLKRLERAGLIHDLQLQVRYPLIPPQVICGKKERGVYYQADFTYWLGDKFVCEDAKGVRTPDYIIKRKMMKEKHGIDVVEV